MSLKSLPSSHLKGINKTRLPRNFFVAINLGHTCKVSLNAEWWHLRGCWSEAAVGQSRSAAAAAAPTYETSAPA